MNVPKIEIKLKINPNLKIPDIKLKLNPNKETILKLNPNNGNNYPK